KATPLRVSHAFHSPHMDGILDAFRHTAERLTFHAARIPIISNVTGNRASDEEVGSPDYWVRHVRQTVRFADCMRTLHAEGARVFLEAGPHGVLTALAQGVLLEDDRLVFVPTLRHGHEDCDALVAAAQTLHARGVAVDWAAFYAPFDPRTVRLPVYAFDR